MSAWLKLNLMSVVPILMINLTRVGWLPALWYPILFFARLCFAKFLSEISDYNTVSNPYDLTCWLVTSLHYTGVLSWMADCHLVVNEYDFSIPFERHTLLKSHDIILHASFHWHHKCHYGKLKHMVVMITWSWNADTERKTISRRNHIISCNISCKWCWQLTYFSYVNCAWYITMILTHISERKDMALTLIGIFKIHFYWYRYEIMP